MEKLINYLEVFSNKYGYFIIGGAIGAVIHRLRNKMSIKRFLSSIFISIFVALAVGIIGRDHFKLSDNIVYVLCGVSGVFSDTILDEIEDIIKGLSEYIQNKFMK